MKTLPVFYHIPKNAGTYVLDSMLILFRHYRRNHTNWLNHVKPEDDSIKSLQVIKDGVIIAKLIVGDPTYFCSQFSKFTTKHSHTEWDIQLSDVTTDLLDNLFLFAVVIESCGVKCRENILCLFKTWDLVQFLILRDPFLRAQSIYNYNMSQASLHDYSHGKILSNTFERYINSYQLEDSWLIRQLTNLSDNKGITQVEFDQTVNILKQFKIYDIANVDLAIQTIFLKCHEIDFCSIERRPWDIVTKNNACYNSIRLEDLPRPSQEVFKLRTVWDEMLYQKFVKDDRCL